MSRSASEASAARSRAWRRSAPFILGSAAGLFLLLGVLNIYARGAVAQPEVGVLWADSPDGVVAVRVEPQGVAAQQGMQVGDLLVRLDGRPPSSALDAGDAPWSTRPGDTLVYELRRGGQDLTVPLVPGMREGDPLHTYLATVGLFFLASALFLIYRLGTGHLTLLYLGLSTAAFCLLVFSHTGTGGGLDWLFYALDSAGRLLFPALLLHFALMVPGEPRLAWPVRLGIYAPAGLFALVSVWLIGGGALATAHPVLTVERLDAWQLLYTAAFLTAALGLLAVRAGRATLPSARRQLRWITWGLGLSTTPFVIFYLIPRGLQVETPPAANLAVLPLILLPLAMTTAILKYRLADLGLFVRSGVTALTLIFFSLAMYALVKLTLSQTLVIPGINRRIFTILAAVVVFLLYPILRRAVEGLVDRAFYLGRYDYRRTLMEFGRELNSERELFPLMARFHDRIRRTLPVRDSVVLLPGDERGGMDVLALACRLDAGPDDEHLRAGHPLLDRIEKEDCVQLTGDERQSLPSGLARLELDAFFPMRVKSHTVAVLGVALKDTEGELNSEDRQLLITLAGHAASAIEGARLYEENLQRIREVELLKDYNESIVESSRVGILVVDPDLRIRGWNPSMGQMFGRERPQAIGREVAEIFSPRLVRLIHSAPREGLRVDRYTHTHGGGTRVFNLAVSELRGKSDVRPGHVVTFDEVTEQVEMEHQLLRNERLAAVGLLASGVAHEINTPLTGIASYSEMLLDDLPMDHEARETVERIHKQSWRASHIANSLLNLSKGEGALEPVNLNDVVEETLSLFGPQIKGRKVEVRFDAGADPLVRGHRGRLQQVLLNLLLNARDAMPGGGEVRVATRREPDGVVLQVSDSGTGIAAEDLEKIYDPFFTTKGRGRGTGLGLSITYGIVQDHGGRIEAESVRGEGTSFKVHFPLVHAERRSA